MAGNEDAVLKEALFKANLKALHPKFLKENIDFEIAQNLFDGQISSLAVATIGERYKLRIALRDAVASKHQGKLLNTCYTSLLKLIQRLHPLKKSFTVNSFSSHFLEEKLVPLCIK